ncbi:MAG: hypothetical protein VR64_19690 [Desulfatitalea sp. BRH_c12]|nr:MAG: hypothetical protein VR64_19690 [Desulfatitalea sp. BRH_c12]
MDNLLNKTELPSWFTYPSQLIRVCELNLMNLEPWIILEGEQLRARYDGLKERYKDRDLVPFARREDMDDVACWEKGQGESVIIIHDFASPGYEQKGMYKDFWDWFRAAVEDMVKFE